MKMRFKYLSLAIALLATSTINSKPSFADCGRNIVEPGPLHAKKLGDTHFKDFSVQIDSTAKGKATNFIKKLVHKYTGSADGYVKNDILSAIDKVYLHLKRGDATSALENAEKMASFAEELDRFFEAYLKQFPVQEGLIKEVSTDGTRKITQADLKLFIARKAQVDYVKRAKYALMVAVQDLEKFKAEEFITVPKESFLLTQGENQKTLTHLALDEYPKYIESMLAGKFDFIGAEKAGTYKNITWKSSGAILSIGDMRNVTSYNLWPLYHSSHDIRHVHFALSHPMALSSMMMSTRSKNHLRCVMLGALYEGVDRVQYSQETEIARYFSTEIKDDKITFPHLTRNLDLEEAMIMLGYLPNAKLVAIKNKLRSGSSIDSFVTQLADWKPKKVEGTNVQGFAMTEAGRKEKTGISLDQDANQMVEDFTKLVKESDALTESIVKSTDTDPAASLTPEQRKLMLMMNYQIDPNKPEISINGLPFKNDGRAHFSSDGEVDAPIGIGDH